MWSRWGVFVKMRPAWFCIFCKRSILLWQIIQQWIIVIKTYRNESMNKLGPGVVRQQMPNFTNVSQMEMCWPANTTNIISKVEKLVKYYTKITHFWWLNDYTITHTDWQITQILFCLWRSEYMYNKIRFWIVDFSFIFWSSTLEYHKCIYLI